MIEMLVCMCIISAFLLVSISNTKNLNLDHYYFLNDYVLTQSEAIKNKEDTNYKKGIYFNSMGHVNQAKTIDFYNHKVIVHLGNGYATKQ